MRTTLNLDEEVLKEAMSYAQGRSKTEVINDALRKLVLGKRQKRLLELRGKVEWQGNLDDLRRRK